MNNFTEEEQKNLISKMHIPARKTLVVLIDNLQEDIEGISSILSVWPNIDMIVLIQSEGSNLNIPPDADIILLDENLDGTTGTEIAKNLIESGYGGTIVSITSGSRPSYTKWHFGGKLSVLNNYETAKSFVSFMNQFLKVKEV
jgi:hypothetical protein